MNDKELKDAMRRYISHWAILPMSQFANGDSLKVLRPSIVFGVVSKTAMLVDATFSDENSVCFNDDEMDCLDTVDAFVSYLKSKGILSVNPPPVGYP